MNKTLLAVLLFAVLSGCTLSPNQGLSSLLEIEQRYLGRGTIAPATIQEIDLMEKELEALKTKSAPAIQEMIGIRTDLLEFSRGYILAQRSIAKVGFAKGGCREQDPLKQGINKLSTVLEKTAAIKQRISGFQKNYATLFEQSNLAIEDFEAFSQTLQNLRNDMQKFYNEACIAKAQ